MDVPPSFGNQGTGKLILLIDTQQKHISIFPYGRFMTIICDDSGPDGYNCKRFNFM